MRTFRLGLGSHADMSKGVGCVNEIASQLAGEDWSDHPAECVDPVITPIAILYNDSFSSDEALNADDYANALPWRLVGTNAELSVSIKRAQLAAAWAKVEAEHAAKYAEAAAEAARSAAEAAAEAAAKYAAKSAANAAKSAAKYAKSAANAAEAAAKYAAKSAESAASQRVRIRALLDQMIALTEPVEPVCCIRLDRSVRTYT